MEIHISKTNLNPKYTTTWLDPSNVSKSGTLTSSLYTSCSISTLRHEPSISSSPCPQDAAHNYPSSTLRRVPPLLSNSSCNCMRIKLNPKFPSIQFTAPTKIPWIPPASNLHIQNVYESSTNNLPLRLQSLTQKPTNCRSCPRASMLLSIKHSFHRLLSRLRKVDSASTTWIKYPKKWKKWKNIM